MTSARAMATRFFMPPERSLGILSSVPFSPTSSSFSATMFEISSGDFSRCSVEVKPDVFADGERIEQRAGLEDERHAVFGGDFRRLDGFAVDEDFAGVRRFQPDEVLEQNALAAAARPHDDENFAGLDVEINALEHFLAVKTLAQPAHLQADAGIRLLAESFIIGSACAVST